MRTQEIEARPFMGDLTFFGVAARLAAARSPLLTVEHRNGSSTLHTARHSLTALGRDVAALQRDAVEVNGIDEWRGGVHLHGRDCSPWRWDAGRQTLVS